MDMDKPPRPERKDVFLNYKIWLSGLTGNGMVDDSTYMLLHLIGEKGSLKAAADEMKISYRKAWGDLEKAEEILGYALTQKHRGGKDGGSSILTPEATRLLEAYTALQQRFDDNVEEAFKEFISRLRQV